MQSWVIKPIKQEFIIRKEIQLNIELRKQLDMVFQQKQIILPFPNKLP